MNRWKIAAIPTKFNIHERDTDVAGVYFFTAESKDEALDKFHKSVPIKVLDDFEIDIELDYRNK